MKPNLSIIPQPVQVKGELDNFSISDDTRIYFKGSIESAGQFLKSLLNRATGFRVELQEVSSPQPDKNEIVLEVNPKNKNLRKEGYMLKVTPTNVIITGFDPAGVFYGVQTLRQLLPVEIENMHFVEDREWSIPCVEIFDYPRFSWRGFMLDVGRHFFGKDVIKQLLDVMALQKMNIFHWHLTEDQGWRLQIKKYPKLIEVGSKRKESQIGGFLSKRTDGKHHEGYFSQEDAKEIVDYASARFIKIVPEIEMPGHCMAALASYPELSCTGGPFEVATSVGIKKDVFCPGKEQVFQFLQAVLDEVMEIFPSEIIHIGGDEVPKDRWRECPECQRRIQEESLKSAKELQVYFTNRMVNYISSKDRRVMGWNEILEAGLEQQVIGQYWLRGMSKVLNHLRNGGRMVISHYFHTYLDYNYGFCPLSKTYHYEPIPKKLEAKYHGNILGIEAPMWTEFAETPPHLHAYVFPRLIAVAETAWTPKQKKNFEDFKMRLSHYLKRLSLMGVQSTDPKKCEPWFLKKLYLKATFWKQASKFPI